MIELFDFNARVRHDAGVATIRTRAPSLVSAVKAIMGAERCPERSIISIKRLKPVKRKGSGLGRLQKRTLEHLTERGIWYAGCGWTYGTRLQTVKTLDSLVKRGLVRKETKRLAPGGPLRDHYTLNKEGHHADQEAGFATSLPDQ